MNEQRRKYLDELEAINERRLKELREELQTRVRTEKKSRRVHTEKESRSENDILDEILEVRKRIKELNQRPSLLYRIWNNPYETLVSTAYSLKAILQMIVGVWLIGRLGSDLSSYGWNFEKFHPLLIVGEGLLLTTAIELAYLLYTKGPDEAIDPLLTGIAALYSHTCA